jgi:hypothetical protein
VSLVAGALRSRHGARPADLIRASVLTAAMPGCLAVVLVWLVPAGCDIRGDPALYRWTCLLPGLMVPVSIAVALLLPLAMLLNLRLGQPVPDGWLAVIMVVGTAAQAGLVGGYYLSLDAAYRRLFLSEVAFVPQPFVAGAISATVYMVALRIGRRPSRARRSHDFDRLNSPLTDSGAYRLCKRRSQDGSG